MLLYNAFKGTQRSQLLWDQCAEWLNRTTNRMQSLCMCVGERGRRIWAWTGGDICHIRLYHCISTMLRAPPPPPPQCLYILLQLTYCSEYMLRTPWTDCKITVRSMKATLLQCHCKLLYKKILCRYSILH